MKNEAKQKQPLIFLPKRMLTRIKLKHLRPPQQPQMAVRYEKEAESIIPVPG